MNNKIENCPCNKCLVKIPCRNTIIRLNKENKEYLIMEFVRKCPDAFCYFYKLYIEGEIGQHQKIIYQPDFYLRIKIMCKIHNMINVNFLWYGERIKYE